MTLEAQLGNALGLAIMFLRTGDWSNRDMARLEAPFKAWCDKVVDGLSAEPQPEPPTDDELDELFTEIDQSGESESWRSYARAVLARWGS